MANPPNPATPSATLEKKEVPVVDFPPPRKATPPPVLPGGSAPPKDEDPALKVEIIEDLNLKALMTSLGIAIIIFIVASFILRIRSEDPVIYVGLPLGLIWTLVVYLRHRLWANVDTQKGAVCLDSLFSDTITVFTQGLHFMPVWYGEEDYELDFQKHEPVIANAEDGTHVEFQTQDGYTMWADFTGFYQNRCNEEALGRRLRYKDPELKALVRATIKSYLSDLGGLNKYETINAYKGQITNWLAGIFGGEGVLSPFELETGIRLKDPILESLDLDDKSKDLWLKRATAEVMVEAAGKMLAIGTEKGEAAKAGQAAAGLLKRTDSNVRIHVDGKDLPPGLTTLVVGEAGLAVGGSGGK